MTKALLRKQLLEVFSAFYRDRKTGKRRSGKSLVSYLILVAFSFCILGVMFYFMAHMLCQALVPLGFGWLYFALVGVLAVFLGVFGSVFNTYASLYLPKDNDLLLPMPILTGRILLARLFGVYIMGLMYELIVMITALIAYFVSATLNLWGIVFCLLIPFVLSLLILTLSCALGWVVALVGSRLKNKSVITVLISLGFLAVYYYACFHTSDLLQHILMDPAAIVSKVKGVLYPFYHMGLAAEGNALSMLIFTAIMLALFGIVYLILSRSFLSLTTSNRGTTRVKYKEKAGKRNGVESALLRKEFKRFLSSSTYMLNCGIGIVFSLVLAVLAVIKVDAVAQLLASMPASMKSYVPLFVAAGIATLASMNIISAPSVSLEGKNIWLLQVFPVTGKQVLHAKLKLHIFLVLPVTVLLAVCVAAVAQLQAVELVVVVAISAIFVVLSALGGLALNLKMPNLHWSNESAPVKQSLCSTLALFGGWVLAIVLGVAYYLLHKWVAPLVFLVGTAVLLTAASVALLGWINHKGSKIFETLS